MAPHTKLNIVKLILGISISINLCQSSANQNDTTQHGSKPISHQLQQASTSSSLKAYRNKDGKIDTQPNSAAHQRMSRQTDMKISKPPTIIPNPKGGWIMVLDGQVHAEQHADRQGKVHCQTKKLTTTDHQPLMSNPK